MYHYIILGFLASAVLVAALFVWLYERLRINWSMRNTIGQSRLLPIFLTIVLLLVIKMELEPRLMDVLAVLQGNQTTLSFHGKEARLEGAKLKVRQHRFVLSPGQRTIDPDKSYRLEATPYAKVVLVLEAIEEVQAEGEQTP